ncbi:MAG: apolipoprotein N-acyltransferase [Pseudomonadota bacterium]
MLDRVAGIASKRPALSALILGLVAALGYPPLHLWWVSLPALAAFIALLRSAPTTKAAAWYGWLFGWAHLTLANNWIATAFTYQAEMPEILGWFAVPLLCIYLAVYSALAASAAHWLARGAPLMAFAAVFAGSWIVFEWMRGWVFTGYPWPPLGLILLGGWETPGVALIAPYMGTYALSGAAVLLAGAVFALARRWNGIALLPVFTILALVMHAVTPNSGDSDIAYTLVQPLIPQDEINDVSKFDEQFERIARLTQAGRGTSRLVLWPESAIPDYLEVDYPQRYYDQTTAVNPLTRQGDPAFARHRIAGAIGPETTLLTGVINLDIDVINGRRRAVSARNSVIAMNGAGEITHTYAKGHLVPFGEYLPFRSILEPVGLSRLVAGTIDYRSGPGPRTLDLGEHGRAGVQICYEIVFSGHVAAREDRPDYIFNPSNDGWFGWWGPPQHLAQARLRAIEEGLPVLRSTTTGISAVIDANGIVRQSVAPGTAGAVEGMIPKAHAPTLFARFGNTLALAWALVLLALGLGLPRLLALRTS